MAASSALNGGQNSARVSAETRARAGRGPAPARALTYRRTHAIGFVTTLMYPEPNAYCMDVFSGVVLDAMAAGQTTDVFTLSSWDEAPARIPALCDGRVDGLVVLAPRLEDDGQAWLSEHTPMVSVHASGSGRLGGVNVESETGAYRMVDDMLALGPPAHPARRRAGGLSERRGRQPACACGCRPGAAARPPGAHAFTTEGGVEAVQA